MSSKTEQKPVQPFFVRFLEAQELENVNGGRPITTLKYPSDRDEAMTMKYPSDSDEIKG